MVNAQELMKNNWILDYKNLKRKVFGFSDDLFWEGGVDSSFTLAEANPIPLTPEILLTCGFEKKDRKPYQDHWRKKVVRNKAFVLYINIGGVFFASYHGGLRVKVEYLHQLQNLYYSLTHQELNYKP